MNKIVVTGHSGGMVRDALVSKGVTPMASDITNKDAVKDELALLAPDVVIHAAAYTGVENCEKNYKTAFQVNVRGTSNVAEACKDVGARLIYLSTCHVFDGAKHISKRYTEMSRPNPQNKYGFTKWEGEEVLSIFGSSYIIVRISKLFSADQYREYLTNPYKSVEPTFIWRNYTYIHHFVDVLLRMTQSHRDFPRHMKINIGSTSATDLCSFKRMLLHKAGYDSVDYVSGRKEKADGYLPRPYNGVLDVSVAEQYGLSIPSMSDGVERMIKEI